MICRLCGNNKQELLFNLGFIPLGNPEKHDLRKRENLEELKLYICKKCFLIQNFSKIVDTKFDTKYSTRSGSIKQHNKNTSKLITKLDFHDKDPLIMEIGCSNGELLNEVIKKKFTNVIGIEPSPHSDTTYHFPLIKKMFDQKLVKELKKIKTIPDVLIASYVVENMPRLEEFFINSYDLLNDDGQIIIEVPNAIDFLENLRVDAFAHMNRYWFTYNSVAYALENFGFQIVDIKYESGFRGGTLTIIGKKTSSVYEVKDKLKKELRSERKYLELLGNNRFENKIKNFHERLIKNIQKLTSEKTPLIGYGGGVKAATLLNWLHLSDNQIDFVVDGDESKQGLIIPNTNIPIKSPNHIAKNYCKMNVIILAIDYTEEITSMLRKNLAPGSKIINLLPRFTQKIVK